MIRLVSLDLWETLIKDEGEGERGRDELRADFIIKTLGLQSSYKDQIMGFFDELVEAFKHPSIENEWSVLPETQIDHLLQRIGVNAKKEDFKKILSYYTECILDYPPVFAEKEVPEVLENLKKKYKVALISNTGRTPGRILLKLLENMRIAKYFDFFAFSDELLLRKPDPAIFGIACSKMDTLPEESVHIGDSYNMDYLGAKAARVNPILYIPYNERPKAEVYIKSLVEIEDKIKEAYEN